jgi:GT2 family glycosyltransferase
MPEVAVIILSYNSLEETTKPCLESIFAASTDCDFEVLVVDNASTDNTREYLQGLQAAHPNLKLLLNEENLGFARGNNQGVQAIEADFYVLLNSDTQVTGHWLDKLLAFAREHPEVGMLGPVSNSVGNEQYIYLPLGAEDAVMEAGCRYAAGQEGSYFYTSMLGFFCVMIRKEVFQSVGFLDEKFGLGYFEDDDFCRRARLQGYKLACLENIFIYHRGSACFSKVDFSALVRENRHYYEQKYCCQWRTSFRIGVFLDFLESCIQQTTPARWEQSLQRMANRIKVMRYFDMECHDDKLPSKTEEDLRDLILDKNQQLRMFREDIKILRNELDEQHARIIQLRTQWEGLMGRADWRLLMKFNSLPGIAAIKRFLRPLLSRIL